jgi:DNA-3-methyladenine glycosylase
VKIKHTPLPQSFYQRDTLIVAKQLLGKLLVRKTKNKILSGMIVEVEAYIGAHDPASHSYQRITPRNQIMYEEGGHAYVYFIYGSSFCVNAVAGREGNGVLIRALEPVENIEQMMKNRNMGESINLTNGPGKLCEALSIDKKFYGTELFNKNSPLIICEYKKIKNEDISISKRIGLKVGMEFDYRFFVKDNKFVSRHKFNKSTVISSNKIKP